MNKLDLEDRRDDIAHGLNGRLEGTGVSVVGGGDKGPYSVTVDRLNRATLDRVLAAVLAATGGTMGPVPGRGGAEREPGEGTTTSP
jgi:hypothetical protein